MYKELKRLPNPHLEDTTSEKYYKDIKRNCTWWLTASCVPSLITDLHTNTSLPLKELFCSKVKRYILLFFFGVKADVSHVQTPAPRSRKSDPIHQHAKQLKTKAWCKKLTMLKKGLKMLLL